MRKIQNKYIHIIPDGEVPPISRALSGEHSSTQEAEPRLWIHDDDGIPRQYGFGGSSGGLCLDGGSASSIYTSGPIIDLGQAS